jgi:hypothetical protein
MGLPNRVLLDGDGRIVVGESGMPQVTNGEGGSCCCDGCSPLPKDMLDEFTGLDQEGNLFFTDDAVKEYPYDTLFAGQSSDGFTKHQPAAPYSAEQLEGDNAKYQLIALKSGDGKNGGATNVLMWNGDDTCGHPWFHRNQQHNVSQYVWNIKNSTTNVKPSIVDNGFANYSPADDTQGWSTSVELRYHDDTTSHGLAQSLETSQDEKPFMGFPSVMGVYTAAPLNRYSPDIIHPATDVGFAIEVSDFSYVLPVLNSDFVQGGTEPYLDFPYVREYERHLKTVKLYYPLAESVFHTFGRGTRQQVMTFFLPIRSGDKLTIEVNPISHEANNYGAKQTFCVRFLINETTLAVETASTQTHLRFSDTPATDNPQQNYYCSFGHGTILATNSRPRNYFEEWDKWAKANNPNLQTRPFGYFFGGWFGRRYFQWPQDNVFDVFDGDGTSNFKLIYVPTYAPFVGGFKNYNHTMQNEPLDFDCGQVNEPVPLVMQNFADATGRTIEAPPPVTPPAAPPATVVLTYPYNWANISTISATSFAAVVTGATSPLTFNVETGSLPSGLSLNTTTGLVSGTASSSGSGTISIKVTDTNSATDTSPVYSWNVTGSGGAGGGGAGGP